MGALRRGAHLDGNSNPVCPATRHAIGEPVPLTKGETDMTNTITRRAALAAPAVLLPVVEVAPRPRWAGAFNSSGDIGQRLLCGTELPFEQNALMSGSRDKPAV